MGEEFYCILKLVSGEEIISLITIDETGDESLQLLHRILYHEGTICTRWNFLYKSKILDGSI